jgi:deoxyribodipyrimidine photo-lyase
VPAPRLRRLNDAQLRPERDFVLYWMTSFRRATWNFALDRAIEHAKALKKALVVFEPLRVGYEFANDRLHTFVLQGMADNARRFADSPVHYFPYVEPRAGDGKGLLEALASRACVLVGDDWPCFFVPAMQAAAARRVDVAFEVVDSNGLYPLRHTTRVFTTAHSFRTHLQKVLPPHLLQRPAEAPLCRLALPRLPELPSDVTRRWPAASPELLAATPAALAALPIDHTVAPVSRAGGTAAAEARLERFVTTGLRDYAEARNEPEADGTSGLSPWLHFGHLSVHQVFARVTSVEGWSVERLGKSIGGAKEGWWRLSPSTEAFLDELVTWRELAFNFSSHRPDEYRSLDSLPSWAKATIAAHAKDPRPHRYSLEQLEHSRTHDPLWNAAMGQLRREGWFHGYLRMLWGKKIYEWSSDAAAALRAMEVLMGKYSLDGRDPVSWSGYFWVLGRYDRPWGPERPIFGKLRFMSSDNTAKKFHVKQYVARYAP